MRNLPVHGDSAVHSFFSFVHYGIKSFTLKLALFLSDYDVDDDDDDDDWRTFGYFSFLLNSHEIYTRKSPVCFFYQKPSTIEYSTISVDQNSQSSTAKHTKLRSISVEVLFYTSIIHFNADTCFFLFHKFFY